MGPLVARALLSPIFVYAAMMAPPLLFSVCAAVFVQALSSPPINVDVTPYAAEHASAILSFALGELRQFVSVHDAPVTCNTDAPTVEFDLEPSWKTVHLTAEAERYSISVGTDGRVHVIGAGLLGLAYAIHDLREFLALSPLLTRPLPGECSQPGAWGQQISAFVARGAPSPQLRAARLERGGPAPRAAGPRLLPPRRLWC